MNTVSTTQPVKKSNKRWIIWLVIAFILAFWSIVSALFFLLIAWIVTQNPDNDLASTVGKQEKSAAQRVYTWLFLSSFITVPVFIIIVGSSYSSSSTNNERVLQAILPLVFHLPLLLGLTSRSRFVYRHTQQGIMLIALRAGVAGLAVSIGDYPDEGLWLFVLGNGLLWFFGSIWGWVQVNRGECWWMRCNNESTSKEESPISQAEPEIIPYLSPEKYLEYSKWYLKRGRKTTARDYALGAFRYGNVDIRRQAVRLLDDLNEVEFF